MAKRGRAARETITVTEPLPAGFGDAGFREMVGKGKAATAMPRKPQWPAWPVGGYGLVRRD